MVKLHPSNTQKMSSRCSKLSEDRGIEFIEYLDNAAFNRILELVPANNIGKTEFKIASARFCTACFYKKRALVFATWCLCHDKGKGEN